MSIRAALSAPLPAALSECWNCGAFTSARDAADRPYCNGLNNRAGKCRAQGSGPALTTGSDQ